MQAEAVQLYKEQVYPDMVGRHLVARGQRSSPVAATYNAAAAAKADRSFRDTFGADGAKLDPRSHLSRSLQCLYTDFCSLQMFNEVRPFPDLEQRAKCTPPQQALRSSIRSVYHTMHAGLLMFSTVSSSRVLQA